MSGAAPPKLYLRPIASLDLALAAGAGARSLAGGALRFDRVEAIIRGGPRRVLPLDGLHAALPGHGGEVAELLARISSPRAPLCGLALDRPRIMGVLNVTPDSFSDGGLHHARADAVMRGMEMIAEGADMVDVGGESTRPGAGEAPAAVEIERTVGVIRALRAAGMGARAPISIDTRKADVARAAFGAGAELFNDVSALSHDPGALSAAAALAAPVCLMHAQGDPKTMQASPVYDDVLLDVYDYLEGRIAVCLSAGVPRSRIVVDPGIGFGKTLEHNLALLRGLSLFHGLGCPILLGASRKRFIWALSGEDDAARRAPGSIAAALVGAGQGVQILRMHDVAETAQALAVWTATSGLWKGEA